MLELLTGERWEALDAELLPSGQQSISRDVPRPVLSMKLPRASRSLVKSFNDSICAGCSPDECEGSSQQTITEQVGLSRRRKTVDRCFTPSPSQAMPNWRPKWNSKQRRRKVFPRRTIVVCPAMERALERASPVWPCRETLAPFVMVN